MEWKRGPIIGRGSYATVSLATTSTGNLFAVKSTDLSASGFLQKEQHFLSRLSSKNIIEYVGFDVDYDGDKPVYNLFMEYATGGTITDVIKRQGGSLDESLIRSYTHQILLGLDYLHLNNLVHCDIKCRNILVSKDGVKIGDLGCAKLVENGGATTSEFSGTPLFMAPEVARGEEQGFPADVWALGCAVIEMATGSHPWPDINDPVSALYTIGCSGDIPEFPKWLPEEGKDFLAKCLKRDAKERWTTGQLLQHSFVSNLNSGSETRKSPTSTLDPGFWESLEVPEPSPAPTEMVDFSSDSQVERIRQLVEATPSSISSLPNWTDEEDWITVRGNDTEQMDLDDGELTRTESFSFSNLLLQDELESSIRDGGFWVLEYPVVETDNENMTTTLVSRISDFDHKINDNSLVIDSNKRRHLLITFAFMFMLSSNS